MHKVRTPAHKCTFFSPARKKLVYKFQWKLTQHIIYVYTKHTHTHILTRTPMKHSSSFLHTDTRAAVKCVLKCIRICTIHICPSATCINVTCEKQRRKKSRTHYV